MKAATLIDGGTSVSANTLPTVSKGLVLMFNYPDQINFRTHAFLLPCVLSPNIHIHFLVLYLAITALLLPSMYGSTSTGLQLVYLEIL